MKKIFTFLLTITVCQIMYGQNGVGIGTTTPHAPLQFANGVQNRKIVLHENANDDHQFYGFGVNGNILRYQTDQSASDHVFYSAIESTASKELMRITGLGLVGIGTLPMNTLDIHHGTPRTGEHPNNRSLYVTGDIEEWDGIEFRHSNGTQGIGFGYSTIYATGSDEDQLLQFSSRGNAPLIFKTNDLQRMTISGVGNVSVGVTAPLNRLDLHKDIVERSGDHSIDQTLYVTGDFAGGKGVKFRQTNGTEGIRFGNNAIYADGSNASQDMSMAAKGPNGNVRFGTNGWERLKIAGNGMIGISNTNPHAPLHFTNDVRNRKIVLLEFNNNDHQFIGFGVNDDGSLRYQTAIPAYDHVFYAGTGDTTSNEVFRIKGSGQIGMGVASPMNKLDISYGPARTGTHPTGLSAYITGDLTANQNVEIRNYDGTQGVGFGYGSIYAAGSGSNQNLSIIAKGTTGNLSFNTDSTERMTITGEGQVGIGTMNPNFKLDVKTGNNEYGIAHTNGDVQIASWIGPGGQIGTVSNHPFNLFAGDGFDQFTLLPNGNIGIGTVVPANKLDIAGAARTGTHNNGKALYVTGGGEFRSADATTGLGFGSNNIFATGSNTSVDLSIAAKGASGNIIYNTNGVEKMRITSSGNVGIGTTNPTYKLDVRTGSNQFGLAQTDGTKQLATYLGDAGEIGTVSNHTFRLFANNGLKQFEMLPNGKIGIGLLGPLNRFDINNGAADRTGTHATGQAMYITGDLGPASNGMEIRHNNATQGIGFGYNTIYAAGTLASQDLNFAAKGAAGNITFSTNSAEKVRITGTGNVGLGITNPNAPLQFSNNLIAKKLVLFDLLNNANEYSGMGVGVSGSMLYQVPSETANFVFSTGAGANSSLELFKFGSLTGFQMNRNLTIDGGMTAWGNVTIGGNATIVGAVTIDSTIITEPFIAPTMINFTNWGSGYAAAAYYKDKMGVVHLRGVVNRAANHNGVIIFTLPAGYRPSTSGKLLFTTSAATGVSRIDILTNGDVVVTAGSTGWISLDGITFRAD